MRFVAPSKLFLVVLATWAAGLAAVGWSTGFLAAHNDFWGSVFIAQHMDFGVPASFHNGFFPLGYSLLLKVLLGIGSLDRTGFWINHIASLVVVAASWNLARHVMPARRALLIPLFIGLHPLCFFYFSTAGVDPGSMAFFLSGLAVALNAIEGDLADKKGEWKKAILAGILFGLAAMWRYHALIAGVLALASIAVAYRRPRRPLIAAAAMATVYAPQILLNLSLGLSPLHTNYELAVYDLMHPINWHRLGELDVPPSMSEVLFADPELFFRRYSRGVVSLLKYVLPVVLFLVAARTPEKKRRATAIILFMLGYALVFGLSVGGRAPLLVLPLALIFLGALLSQVYDRMEELWPRWSILWRGTAMAGIVLVLGVFLAKDSRVVNTRMETDGIYRETEMALRHEGVRDARTVFTTDFDLYFRGIPPFRPRYNGGWGLLGTYRWKEEYPQAPTENLEDFVAECQRHGWNYVVLSPRAERVAPFLGDAYHRFMPEHGTVPIRRVGQLAIFAVKGPS